MRKILILTMLVMTAIWGSAQAPQRPSRPKGPGIEQPDGLHYWELTVGTGKEAAMGSKVKVHYTGWLLESGTKFDSSLDRGEPFTFNLGKGEVIKGWDEGVAGMKVGGKRLLRIPPELGYGYRGMMPAIPGNAYLIFEVELLDVN